MQKITTFLWFNDQAEEAMNYYLSIFKNSKVLNVSRYGDAGPGPKGSVMTASFELEGQQYIALNGNTNSNNGFTKAISLFVNCENQEEVDELWAKLTEGGKEVQCGWLEDKFGVSWQIVPSGIFDLLQHKDPQKAAKAMQAMIKMIKLDINALKAAVDA